MSKARIILEIVTLLQGTPVDEFARRNLTVDGERVAVRCAQEASLGSTEGEACKRAIATALRRFSYRFDATQLSVMAELYVAALWQLEPGAVPRVRTQMCDPLSEEAQRDAVAALAVCERLSTDY